MSECIEFEGHRDKDGYGRQYNPRTQRQAPAHRLVYEEHHGVVLDPSVVVRHTCDNPPCVNPSHLEAGSAADNQADVVSRGRLGRRKGEQNNQATLSDEQVQEVRSLLTGRRGELTELGRRFGVSRVTIANIRDRRYRA